MPITTTDSSAAAPMARRAPSTWRFGIDEPGAILAGPRLRAQRSGIDPRLNQVSEQRLRAGGGVASGARLPAPCNEIVARQVLVEERKVATAVAVGILDLATNLA